MHDHRALKFCEAISSTCDENSTYRKNYNEKEGKRSFMTPLSERKGKRKKPLGRPPPLFSPLLSPAVNHPPHAKMKHTGEEDALVPEFATRWRARKDYNLSYCITMIERSMSLMNML